MHVFHYGGYESGAVKRLMQRHATREDEVDRLLRGGVFVDLLNVVRQGVRASVESYSLKQIEKFYLPQREGPVTEAGFSVVEYERWMRQRDDPRMVPRAHRLDKISFEEMLEFASLGAKVLQVRSVELGMVHKVRIFVRSSFDKPEDIDPRLDPPGTLICDEEDIVEQQVVTGIAFSKDEAQISVRHVPDKPGVAAAIFGPLAEAAINVDMIVQNVSADNKTTDLTFTVPAADYQRSMDVLDKAKGAIGYDHIDGSTDVAKVSVIGIGMRSHAGVAAEAFKALAGRGVNIRAITTSEIKFSVLIDAAYTELAVRTLHSLYGLDKS